MDLAHRRLRNQFIDGSRLKDPAEVVQALGAVQAQDYQAALWALGLRLPGRREADIERAILERRIVRTWPMRGTLHFVAAEDVRWLLELLSPRVLRRSAARLLRDFAIDRSLIERAGKIVRATLNGGHAMTRAALYERLETKGIATDKQRGMHILWWLAHEGLICCGPRAHKQHTFVLLDEWLPAASSVTREAALARLAQRYFAHHGPATLGDFTWWSGLTAADANAAIEAASARLVSETLDKTIWWSGPHTKQRRTHTAACHLLPVYDEYTIGYADRSASLAPAHAKDVAAGYGIFRAPIVLEGRIVGSWTRELKKDRVEIRLRPLARFQRGHMQHIKAAAERYGEFLGVEAIVTDPSAR